MKQKIIIIILSIVAVLGSSSGWVYHFWTEKKTSDSELMALQVSFLKQYGSTATVKETISPKIYEIAWSDDKGNNYVSMNVGGVWVVIANNSAPTPTPTPSP